jgi:hypothetical protein
VRARALLALAAALTGGLALRAAAQPPVGQVTPPQQAGLGRSAVLVLLPDAGSSGADLSGVVPAAQRAADRARLWVAVPTVPVAPGEAEVVYAALLREVRAQGFAAVTDADVVVAGWGRGADSARQLGTRHRLAGVAALGSAAAPVDLRVLGELDRSVPVVSTTASSSGAVLVLPAADAAGLRGAAAGAVLGDLVEQERGLTTDLTGLVAADGLVSAIRAAHVAQSGSVCAALQHHTADLAPADAGLIDVADRADADLVAPTPEGATSADLGGFLYDKASLADDGGTARLTTVSYVVRGAGPAATEVMCKTKSRSAVAQAVYDDHTRVDGTEPTCAGFTEATLDDARAAMSPQAVSRSGGVTVLADRATSAGPQWVFTPMTVAPADPVTGRWQVQSPSLVTQLSDTELDPEFAGNHYCKVLSPLRAFELLLQDTVPA